MATVMGGLSREGAKNQVMKMTRAESASTRSILDELNQSTPFAQAMVLSAAPRGALHIIQPARLAESMPRLYGRVVHQTDRLAWTAIMGGKAVRAGDCWPSGQFEASRLYLDLLIPFGLRHVATAPLAAPIFDGYPGALHICRNIDQPDFNPEELGLIQAAAGRIDEVAQRARDARPRETAVRIDRWLHTARRRFYVYGRGGKLVYPSDGTTLPPEVEGRLGAFAAEALQGNKKPQPMDDRLALPDEYEDHWVFHVVRHESFPTGEGPHLVACLQPQHYEWAAVRGGDVAADPELMRMLPAIRYMASEFHRGPNLDAIARRSHLSAFHFHRRFTDLVGQTPKEFMLSCQVHEAKKLLASLKRPLPLIARDCGFAHQSHFISRFKQATGLTPTRWRRYALMADLRATI